MTEIIIVYHSGYGHTKKQAEAIHAGMALVPEIRAELLPINAEGELPAEGWDVLATADCVVFGAPTYMGSVS